MIELQAVSKVYGSGARTVNALQDVSLSIAHREFVAVVGPSGSGKSTLMQIIGCLDVPTSGSYALNGQPVARLNDRELSRIRNQQVGFVFQTFNLVPRTTALENVELPIFYGDRAPDPEKARAVLGRVGLEQRADHYPNQLSGGEQQRVAIARALVLGPALLIADEPTGNLDAATGTQILDLLCELHESGLTVVLVTHDASVAARAERVLTLADGRIVADNRSNSRLAVVGR